MKTYDSIETERITLRRITENDAEFILELVNTPKWLKYIGDRNIHTIKEASVFIKSKVIPQHDRLGYSNYILVRKSDNARMGTCGLYDRENVEGVDISFALLPQFEKKGYATESAKRIIETGFTDLRLKRIYAMTRAENINSVSLILKLGFEHHSVVKIPGDDTEYQQYILDNNH